MIEKALRLGASEVEIFEINARMHNVYIDNGDPKIATSNSWKGTGIKCIRNGHIGFSGGSSPEETLKRSIHLMKIAPKDENFHSLPSPKSVSGEVDGAYNPDLLNEDLVEMGAKIARAAQPVSIMYGLIRAIEYHTHIMNSLGVDGEHRGTILFIHLNAKRGSGEGIVKWYSAGSYSLDVLESLGTNLRERTNRTVLARPFSGKKGVSALIMPGELGGLLSALFFAINGEQVNRKRSLWSEMLGEQVASSEITLIDDGRLPGGLRSGTMDDEGVPTSRKVIIDHGKLKSFVYDSYNGGIAAQPSTGNGWRRGVRSVEQAHLRQASCAMSNPVILPISGSESVEDLEGEGDVVVYKTADPSADPFSGSFALELRDATYHGEPIKRALLCGNLFENIKNVKISTEVEHVENAVLPAILFSGLTLVGIK